MSDFESIDTEKVLAAAKGPRQSDGSLPDIGLRLDRQSQLIDAGTDVGLPYRGSAPDLGAFEIEK